MRSNAIIYRQFVAVFVGKIFIEDTLGIRAGSAAVDKHCFTVGEFYQSGVALPHVQKTDFEIVGFVDPNRRIFSRIG